MPLYQYNCSKCKKEFEELKKLSDRDEPSQCPRCGNRAERVLAGFAVGASSGGGTGQFTQSGGSCGTGGG